MAKSRQEKKEIIDQMAQDLKESQIIVIANYQGLNNLELQKLRDRLKKEKAKLQVVKNTLFKIALKKVGLKVDSKLFTQPLVISLSNNITPARIFRETEDEVENLEILGGIYEREYRKRKYVEKLAQIPSRKDLLIKLAAQLKAPQYGLVWILKGNLLKLLSILKERAEQETEKD